MFSFESKYQLFDDSPIWSGHFEVPLDIAKEIKLLNIRRIICTINNSIITYSSIHQSHGVHYILLNKENKKKLNLVIGSSIQVKIEEDTSKYGYPICEEMKELLEQDEEGANLFHQLTIGKQRSLLYLVNKPKGIDIRLRKGIVILEYLKQTQGKLDFKQLNQAFKNDPK